MNSTPTAPLSHRPRPRAESVPHPLHTRLEQARNRQTSDEQQDVLGVWQTNDEKDDRQQQDQNCQYPAQVFPAEKLQVACQFTPESHEEPSQAVVVVSGHDIPDALVPLRAVRHPGDSHLARRVPRPSGSTPHQTSDQASVRRFRTPGRNSASRAPCTGQHGLTKPAATPSRCRPSIRTGRCVDVVRIADGFRDRPHDWRTHHRREASDTPASSSLFGTRAAVPRPELGGHMRPWIERNIGLNPLVNERDSAW